MIDRPDWGDGGRGVVPVPATPAYRTASEVPTGTVMTGYEVAALDGGQNESTGLSPELVREMSATAEGFDATLQMMQAAAEETLADYLEASGADRDVFIAAFDRLPIEVQNAAYRDLKNYPTSSMADRVRRIKGKLTLDGVVAAKRFAREVEGAR